MVNLRSAQCRLSAMLVLTASFFVIEIIVGYITNSMALIADSFHMFSDAIALVIAFISVRMSPKKWSKNTFGWARAEILGALINAVFLCALCVSILIESIKRFISPHELHEPGLLFVVGALGLFINLIGLLLFRGHHHHHHHHHHHGHSHHHLDHSEHHATSSQMNMHGVFLHVMADALGSVIVMISAFINLKYKNLLGKYIDPTLSVIMTVPTHIEVDSLRRRLILEIPGVLAVHEFHVWQLAGDRIIASAHIRCHNLQDYMRIAEKVKEFFHNEGIHSTTIQPEFIDFENEVHDNGAGDNCVLDCPPTQRPHCAPQTCCGNQRNEPTQVSVDGGEPVSQPEHPIPRRTTAKPQQSNASDAATDCSTGLLNEETNTIV